MNIKFNKFKSYLLLIVAITMCFNPVVVAKAETAAAITFGTIDYELFTLQVYNNNNTVVYYSTDNTTWTEVEGAYNSTSESYTMDISWISSSSDVTLYFKGNTVKTIKSITLPMQNSTFNVDYDKAEGSFTFNDAEETDTFEWRKSSDYNWKTVDMDETSSTYTTFISTVDKFKVTGATIIIRLPQVIGAGVNDVGMRASREVAVLIAARTAAPTVKVNSSKLTINTTTVMEYYDSTSGLWIECSGIMSLDEVAPGVLYDNGAKATTLKIRRAATETAPYSKTQYLKIPAQAPAPVVGDSSADVTYYSMNSKLILQFNKATSKIVYEYVIVKEDGEFNLSTAYWKPVKSSTIISISSSTAPDNCSVYVRRKGTDVSTSVDLILASDINSFTVKY